MKILFVNKYSTVTGGADRYALELADLLRGSGHDVRLIAFRSASGPPLPGWYLRPTFTGQSRLAIGTLEAAHVMTTMLWNREAYKATLAAIRDFRPDLVHVHKIHPQLSVAPVLAAARYDLPVVQRAADYEFMSANPEDPRGGLVDTISEQISDRIANTASYFMRRTVHVPRVNTWMVATEFMRDMYAKAGIVAEAIPHSIVPIASERGRPFGDRLGIAFFGRLVPAKGIDVVVNLARARPDVGVNVVGTGPLLQKITDESHRLPNLKILGHLPHHEVVDLMDRTRVVVIPSQWPEPAGLVALEAMSRGTPVVATTSGGLLNYVQSNGGGVLREIGDTTGFIESAEQLHDDAASWAVHSGAGIAGVGRNHDPMDHAARIEALYRRTLG